MCKKASKIITYPAIVLNKEGKEVCSSKRKKHIRILPDYIERQRLGGLKPKKDSPYAVVIWDSSKNGTRIRSKALK